MRLPLGTWSAVKDCAESALLPAVLLALQAAKHARKTAEGRQKPLCLKCPKG